MTTFPETPTLLVGYAGAATTVAVTASPVDGSLWTELITSTAAECLLVGITYHKDSTATVSNTIPYTVEVGVGGSGSEVAVATILTTQSGGNMIALPVPPRVAAGVRVSMRLTTGQGYTNPCRVGLIYCPTSAIDGL